MMLRSCDIENRSMPQITLKSMSDIIDTRQKMKGMMNNEI